MSGRKSGSAQCRREQFFNAVISQKLNTIRWSLSIGGLTVGARDAESRTSLMIAAGLGKVKSLSALLYALERNRDRDTIHFRDDEGRTAMHMAAAKGHLAACEYLYEAKASLNVKDFADMTPLQYAKKYGHNDVVEFLLKPEGPSDDEDIDGAEEEDCLPGETTTQRNKRKRREKEKLERGKGAGTVKEDTHDEENDDIPDDILPDATWNEVKSVLSTKQRELTVLRDQPTGDNVLALDIDPALWYCKFVNTLKLQLPGAWEMPGAVGMLSGLTTLILSHNRLSYLPPEIGDLTSLRVLEAENNRLVEFPDTIGQLTALEVINVSGNRISSLEPLNGLKNLVTLSLDRNMLTTLTGLVFASLGRLVRLSACENELVELSADIGQCSALVELSLSDNQITTLPIEMGNLKEKKFITLRLNSNPIKDARIKKILNEGRQPAKEVLQYLRKQGGGGKKGKGKK